MRALLTSVLPELVSTVGPDQLVVLTTSIKPCSLEDFLRAPIPGDFLVWDPMDEEGGKTRWSLAGRGKTVGLNARGAELHHQAERTFFRLLERRDAKSQDVPCPRMFGGLAFCRGEKAEGLWQEFGEANFTMPRWMWMQSKDKVFLRLALLGHELTHPERVLNEIDAVTHALNQPFHKKHLPAVSSIRTEHVEREAWRQLVQNALQEIKAGRFQKVVAAQRSKLHTTNYLDPIEVVQRIGATLPRPIRFAFQRGEITFLGASPERLVSLRGDQLETEALSGSMARPLEKQELQKQQLALLASDKERREHAFVVEGIEASLKPFCTSVHSTNPPHVRILPHVIHLCTPIAARVDKPIHVLELAQALHPTPAVCGLPREPALAWIAEQEPTPRGWYAGPVGWFDAKGNGAFAVAIRSAVLAKKEAWLYAGVGIVEGSEPDREYEESACKLLTMLNAFGLNAFELNAFGVVL